MLSKFYTDERGIKQSYHGVFACTGDTPLATARRLSPRADWQTMV